MDSNRTAKFRTGESPAVKRKLRSQSAGPAGVIGMTKKSIIRETGAVKRSAVIDAGNIDNASQQPMQINAEQTALTSFESNQTTNPKKVENADIAMATKPNEIVISQQSGTEFVRVPQQTGEFSGTVYTVQQSVAFMNSDTAVTPTITKIHTNETIVTQPNEATVHGIIESKSTSGTTVANMNVATTSTASKPTSTPKQIQVTVPQRNDANSVRNVQARPFVPLYQTNPATSQRKKISATMATSTQQMIDASMQQSIPARVVTSQPPMTSDPSVFGLYQQPTDASKRQHHFTTGVCTRASSTKLSTGFSTAKFVDC